MVDIHIMTWILVFHQLPLIPQYPRVWYIVWSVSWIYNISIHTYCHRPLNRTEDQYAFTIKMTSTCLPIVFYLFFNPDNDQLKREQLRKGGRPQSAHSGLLGNGRDSRSSEEVGNLIWANVFKYFYKAIILIQRQTFYLMASSRGDEKGWLAQAMLQSISVTLVFIFKHESKALWAGESKALKWVIMIIWTAILSVFSEPRITSRWKKSLILLRKFHILHPKAQYLVPR